MESLVVTTLGWLDRARSAWLRMLAPWLGPLYRDAQARVLWLAIASIVVALVLSSAAPLAMLAVSPLLLGVPHLLADLRYLVVRPGLHRRPELLIVAAPLVAMWLAPTPSLGLWSIPLAALVARDTRREDSSASPFPFASPSFAAKRIAVAGLGIAAWWLSDRYPWHTSLFLVHGHHLVAFAVWALAFGRSARAVWVPFGLFLALSGLIVSGAMDAILLRISWFGTFATATPLEQAFGELSPFGPDQARWGARFLLLFVFGQAVHYAIWLRLIPEDARERPGMRGFASSLRALRRDLGAPLVLACIGGVVWLLYSARTSWAAARYDYLVLASFHAYLEFACVALLLLEGRSLTWRPRRSPTAVPCTS